MRLLITGGGTGGHVYPGIAIAKELVGRGKNHEILFVGAERGIEATIAPREGFEIETLAITGIKGKGVMEMIKSVGLLAKAVIKARKIIKRFKPDVALGVGGYASAPVGLATIFTGTPLALAEQNQTPGLTNTWLARFSDKVFVSWPGSEQKFPKGKAILTGNPIRPDFMEVKRNRSDNRISILITGGSQGAGSINRSMNAAIKKLNTIAGDISVVHQTGPAEINIVKKAYLSAAFPWEADIFFNDMPQRIADADLVISRAGAGAIAEICAVGRAAIYIPFPHAADDHQSRNAEAMVRSGAAVLMPDALLSGDALFNTIRSMIKNRGHLERMGEKAKAFAAPNAAVKITDILIDISEGAA